MEIESVRVRNYRSIRDTGRVDIEDDITTLLGKNESGKSSFLKAIESIQTSKEYSDFELNRYVSDSDINESVIDIDIRIDEGDNVDFSNNFDTYSLSKYPNGDRIVYPNRNKRKLVRNMISTMVMLEKDLGIFSGRILESDGDKVAMPNILDNVSEHPGKRLDYYIVLLEETLEKLKTSVNILKNSEDNDLNQEDVDYILNSVQELIQNARNMETITNPDSEYIPDITFQSEVSLIQDTASPKQLNSDEYRTFRNLLEVMDIDYEKLPNKERPERRIKLESAGMEIEGDVNEIWKQKSVKVDVTFADNVFQVLIKDSELYSDGSESESVTRMMLPPTERSKGFQWFFSFYVNLRATTDGRTESADIVLLDDPAVYLHPEGKRNWLNAIEEMSENTQIVYSSHSPFLIRKEYPERIRVVEDKKDKGTRILTDFHETDESTLEPLRRALGIGLGDSPFVSKRKILVEGPSDYFILNGILNYDKETLERDIVGAESVTVMPTNGGNNMTQAAKWVNSEEFAYVLLLDHDEKGKDVQETIEEDHPEIADDRILFLSKDLEGVDFNIEIEDMFSPEFYIDCLNTACSNSIPDFNPISVERIEENRWELDGSVEYTGRKLTSKIEEVFENHGWGDLDKVAVAREIKDRLDNGNAVSEEDVRHFSEVLGNMKAALY